MAALAGREASKMLIMSVLSAEDAGEGESSAMQRWEDLLQALDKAERAFPAAGVPPDGRSHWIIPPVVAGIASVLLLGGLVYLVLACCRCFGPRRRAAAMGADV